MKQSHRHTIMDGRVVTFARDFETVRSHGPFAKWDAIGPYKVSASRNAIIVHDCEIRSDDEYTEFVQALIHAWRSHRDLAGCNGRPNDNDDGSPRELT